MADIAYTAYCQEDYKEPITDIKHFSSIGEVVEFFGVSENHARNVSYKNHILKGVQDKRWFLFKGDLAMFEVECYLGEEAVKEFYRR